MKPSIRKCSNTSVIPALTATESLLTAQKSLQLLKTKTKPTEPEITRETEDMTIFLNPIEESYKRFGSDKAPGFISWSGENRSQLIRIPAASGEYRRAEMRSPDPSSNPYLAFALMIYAGIYGIRNRLELPPSADLNLYKAPSEELAKYKRLPQDLEAACRAAADSDFIKKHIPTDILDIYCKR